MQKTQSSFCSAEGLLQLTIMMIYTFLVRVLIVIAIIPAAVKFGFDVGPKLIFTPTLSGGPTGTTADKL